MLISIARDQGRGSWQRRAAIAMMTRVGIDQPGFAKRHSAAIVIGAAVAVMVLSTYEIHRADDLARSNQAAAQQQSDQLASFYTSFVPELFKAGKAPTNAQLAPEAVGHATAFTFGYNRAFDPAGFSGSARLLERDEIGSDSQVFLTIEVDRTYPEAFGRHGTIETCYAAGISTGPVSANEMSEPVMTIMPDCPEYDTPLYPLATS
jgi:hypothetical protein